MSTRSVRDVEPIPSTRNGSSQAQEARSEAARLEAALKHPSGSGVSAGTPIQMIGVPPRVMVFHWNGDLYGASRSLLRFTSRLAAEGGRPVVVLGQQGPLAAALRLKGVEVRHTRWMAALERTSVGSIRGLLLLMVRTLVSVPLFARLISSVNPDVVHTNTSVVLTSGLAARLTGRPHIWHMREMYTDFPRTWAVYRRFVSAMSRRVVCISECVADQFPGEVIEAKVEVVHNGIPRNEMGPADSDRLHRLRSEFRLDGMLNVGVIGRINLERKGQHLLVEAAARLSSVHPGARFLVIGEPYPGKEAEEVRLRSLVRELGLEDRVVFTGEIAELPLIYGLLDIVVVPSPVPEPFGNTAPEAMAYGIPVVGSDGGGTAEIIDHGRTGLLFPVGDADSLAGCLDLLLDDAGARRALGLAGQQAFRERFEFEGCYAGLRRVMTEVAGVWSTEELA